MGSIDNFLNHMRTIRNDRYGDYIYHNSSNKQSSWISQLSDQAHFIRFIKIDRTMNALERHLSYASRQYGIGTLTGAVKCLIGVTQAICALAGLILFALPALCSRNAREYFKFSAKHLVHGISNIFVGIVEAIPFAQQQLFKARRARLNDELNNSSCATTGYADKFITYSLLMSCGIDVQGTSIIPEFGEAPH